MDLLVAKLRILLTLVVVGLLLMFGQQQATRHALSHVAEALKDKGQESPEERHCDVCKSLAAYGSVVPVPAPAMSLATLSVQAQSPGTEHSAPAAAVNTGYRTRAPPRRA